MILQATLKEVNAYLQVVVPDDPLFEVQYHLLKEHLFSKYRRPLPDEFSSKSGGVDFLPGSDGSETAAFTPAPRITEADEQNDTRSLRRALDKRLFFLVKSKGDILASPNLACQSSSACYQVCLPAFPQQFRCLGNGGHSPVMQPYSLNWQFRLIVLVSFHSGQCSQQLHK